MNPTPFEQRKADHIRLSLSSAMQAQGDSGFEQIELRHEALPEIDFSEVSLEAKALGFTLPTPFLISCMTAGHDQALALNQRLAEAANRRGWLMGVGSQRKQLFDHEARQEWVGLRRTLPNVRLIGNLGLSQAIRSTSAQVQELVDSLEAVAMVIHTNPLQECLQPEGTPQFKDGLKTLQRLSKDLCVPVILKETGCGFSAATLSRLQEVGLAAVDVSGLGGTHWGRIEGARAQATDVRHEVSRTFANWGISTVESLLAAREVKASYEIWASGGIRSGLDAAKALALGARLVGFAQPALQVALLSEAALDQWMTQIEFELKTAMFCTGNRNVTEFDVRQVWQWRKT
ncbi:MAG: type 2 isopentenyl-diphosphate Delta-isomerase [Bdellovibrionales bacterium]